MMRGCGGHGGVLGLGAVAGEAAGVPDVPLVEGEVELRFRLLDLGPDRVRGRDHRVDEVVHVHCRGQEAQRIAVELLVVGVQRDVVDRVVGSARAPSPPRRRRSACAELEQPQATSSIPRSIRRIALPVSLASRPYSYGGLVADLPRAVHLVAEAPQLDAERVGGAVGDAPVGPVGAARVVGVLEQVAGLLQPAGAEVDRHHRLGADLGRPS